MPEKVKEVNFNICERHPKLIFYHSNVPLSIAKQMSVLSSACIKSNDKKSDKSHVN